MSGVDLLLAYMSRTIACFCCHLDTPTCTIAHMKETTTDESEEGAKEEEAGGEVHTGDCCAGHATKKRKWLMALR